MLIYFLWSLTIIYLVYQHIRLNKILEELEKPPPIQEDNSAVNDNFKLKNGLYSYKKGRIVDDD